MDCRCNISFPSCGCSVCIWILPPFGVTLLFVLLFVCGTLFSIFPSLPLFGSNFFCRCSGAWWWFGRDGRSESVAVCCRVCTQTFLTTLELPVFYHTAGTLHSSFTISTTCCAKICMKQLSSIRWAVSLMKHRIYLMIVSNGDPKFPSHWLISRSETMKKKSRKRNQEPANTKTEEIAMRACTETTDTTQLRHWVRHCKNLLAL